MLKLLFPFPTFKITPHCCAACSSLNEQSGHPSIPMHTGLSRSLSQLPNPRWSGSPTDQSHSSPVAGLWADLLFCCSGRGTQSSVHLRVSVGLSPRSALAGGEGLPTEA